MKIAIACAAGIGDALILSIASFHLQSLGHETVTISPHLGSFGAWHSLRAEATLDDPLAYDALLVQHDNTTRAKALVHLRSQRPVYVFYTNYRESKHGPLLAGYDFAFDENRTMVENTIAGAEALFGGTASCQIGLAPPPGLVHRKFPLRIAIHPTSTSEEKNWPKSKFLKLKEKLKAIGYDPFFIASPSERAAWPSAPYFASLSDLAAALYESGGFIGNDSGPGHLASYLDIPTLVIGRQERQLRLWRPGWRPAAILCPPRWLPNIKGLRLREEKWKHFITTRQVIKSFKSII